MFTLSNSNTAATVSTSKFFNKTGIYPVVFKGWKKNSFDSKGGKHFETLVAEFEGLGEFAGKTHEVTIYEPNITPRKKDTYGYKPGDHEEPLTNIIYILLNTSKAYAEMRKDGKEVSAATWDLFRDEVIKFNADSIGTETNLKLIARSNKDGYINANIPGFNLAFTKEQNEKQGDMIMRNEIQPYMVSKWLGKELVFTKKEMKNMNATPAKPTNVEDLLGMNSAPEIIPTMSAPSDSFADFLNGN